MNDTKNATKISNRENIILSILLKVETLSSSGIHAEILKHGSDISLVTVKRELSKMVGKGLLNVKGSGRATEYEIAVPGRVFAEIDPHEYVSQEPDSRHGSRSYNFDLFRDFPTEIFTKKEEKLLSDATEAYKEQITGISEELQKKELERFVIELSWKSSRIEGNTYSLLDTEKLIKENKTASDKTEEEARMILNHKEAFAWIMSNTSKFKKLESASISELHSILVDGMGVSKGLRKSAVGITGSTYRPLDNVYQIKEAMDDLSKAVNRIKSPYAKAVLSLVGISYIQPFEDGNKRTSRLSTNALLMAHNCAPLSYRSVSEDGYREAQLVFYELNSIVAFKRLFIEQYDFAARNYAVKRGRK